MAKLTKSKGLRTRFRVALDPTRSTHPRKTVRLSAKASGRKRSLLNHPVKWYLDGHLVDRPMNGAYAMAMFAEWLLAKAKEGKAPERETQGLFADTRRFLDMLLRNKPAGKRMYRKQLDGMAPRVASLIEKASEIYSVTLR